MAETLTHFSTRPLEIAGWLALSLTFAASCAAQQPAPAQLTPERRADILMARKMYREALDLYREAPHNAVISNKMGIAHHQMTQIGQAKRYYEKAVKLDPKYSEAINNLVTVYYAAKSYRRAINQYMKALKIAPNS
ncbi:MAG: tetratricopeptide repeat protein, partial [Bryobacterales bacterium]|nr:tetratricopeptide repeat protein [Bryobacterales bacterium]